MGDNCPTLISEKHFPPVAWGKHWETISKNQCTHPDVPTGILTSP